MSGAVHPICLFGRFRALPGHLRELTAIVEPWAERSRELVGCDAFVVCVDADAGELLLFERYASEEALAETRRMPELAAVSEAMAPHLAEPPAVLSGSQLAARGLSAPSR